MAAKEKQVNLGAELAILRDSISALIDPQSRRFNGEWHEAPSLYDQLTESVDGDQGQGAHHGAFRSMPLIWVDCVDLITEIDNTCIDWKDLLPDLTAGRRARMDTAAVLAALAERDWSPEAIADVRRLTSKCEAWTRRIGGMLDPAMSKTISSPCPVCEGMTAFKIDTANERVRMPALAITAGQCVCRCCGAVWPPERWEMLAYILSHPLLYRTNTVVGLGILTAGIRVPSVFLMASGQLTARAKRVAA